MHILVCVCVCVCMPENCWGIAAKVALCALFGTLSPTCPLLSLSILTYLPAPISMFIHTHIYIYTDTNTFIHILTFRGVALFPCSPRTLSPFPLFHSPLSRARSLSSLFLSRSRSRSFSHSIALSLSLSLSLSRRIASHSLSYHYVTNSPLTKPLYH
jgi:hypothetical protein